MAFALQTPFMLVIKKNSFIVYAQQVYLVAGGYDNHDYISTTETLVEGGQAWNFQQPLPTSRLQLRGISLPDTVIMTG